MIYTPEHEAWMESIRRFVADEIDPHVEVMQSFGATVERPALTDQHEDLGAGL